MSAGDQFSSRFGLGRVALIAGGLGVLGGLGLTAFWPVRAMLWAPSWYTFAYYLLAMVVFHFLEFVWAARCVRATRVQIVNFRAQL